MRILAFQLLKCVLLLPLMAGGAFAEIKLFSIKSWGEIEARYQGEAFIVALWSLECPPCFKELATLASWQKMHPSVNLVLISTDDSALIDDAEMALARYELAQTEQWIFADSFTQRLRFSIDQSWRGELPRSYMYDRNNTRQAYSGTLMPEQLERWTSRQKSPD